MPPYKRQKPFELPQIRSLPTEGKMGKRRPLFVHYRSFQTQILEKKL